MIPNKFQTSSPLTAVYDHSDFIEGIGYTVFYPYVSIDSTGLYYGMTPSSTFASINRSSSAWQLPYIETQGNVLTTSWAESVSLTFNSPTFNRSRILQGTAYLVFGTGYYSAISTTFDEYYIFTLYKHDGTTATQIATVTTSTITSSNAMIHTIALEVPKTKLKVGEYIQAKLQIYGIRTGAATSLYTMVGHDPLNRDGQTITPSSSNICQTRMEVHIPFKITS